MRQITVILPVHLLALCTKAWFSFLISKPLFVKTFRCSGVRRTRCWRNGTGDCWLVTARGTDTLAALPSKCHLPAQCSMLEWFASSAENGLNLLLPYPPSSLMPDSACNRFLFGILILWKNLNTLCFSCYGQTPRIPCFTNQPFYRSSADTNIIHRTTLCQVF